MQLAELIGKLRTKKQAAERTTFQHYLATVRELARGAEIDSDEVAAVLDATGKDESNLERDVGIQQQRLAWAAQLAANRQAVADRLQAERELQNAQQALQAAHDKLRPAIDAAQSRMRTLDQIAINTMQAESHLAENILDSELLERESVLNGRLREIQAELRPLLTDREHRQSSLMNAELHLRQLLGRNPDTWPGFGMINPKYWSDKDIKPAEERVADLKNQVRQLDEAIRPRQIEQSRLQRELDGIHQQKLLP